jgi:arylsulfatase A-like enzyme
LTAASRKPEERPPRSVETQPPEGFRRTWDASWTFAGLCLVLWVPVILLTFHIRYTILDADGGGFEFLSEALKLPSSYLLSPLQQLAMFREDLTVACLLIPAILLPALFKVPSRYRVWLMEGISVTALLVMFIELKCFWEVGTFLPWSVLAVGVKDVGRRYLQEYLRYSSVGKLGVLLAMNVALGGGLSWLGPRVARWRRGVAMLITVVGALVLVTTLVAWVTPLPNPNPYRSSVLVESFATFFSLDANAEPVDRSAPVDSSSLLVKYRELTHAPVPNRRSAYWGKAAGYDVLVVVLETAPYACLNLDSLETLPPNMRWLAQRSFLATQYHTTYPYTVRATFSMFSSWYPSNGPRDFVVTLNEDYPQLMAPGVARTARDAGYRTALFNPNPVDDYEHDRTRYTALGFDSIVTPNMSDVPPLLARASGDERRERTHIKDTRVLDLLKHELRLRTAAKQRYFIAFGPQYSHAPWPEVVPTSTDADVMQSGRRLFAVVDEWLGELTAVLKEAGTLDHTLIVLVGDHGIRTKQEHPSFTAGTLDDMTFHVPLLIFAPGIVKSPKVVSTQTSHIDLSPTLLDLLGLDRERELEEGSPIWEERLKDRTTFFMARNYLGTDGYYESGKSYMLKYPIHAAFESKWDGRLHFETSDIVSAPATVDSVVNKLKAMNALQSRWAMVMIPDHYHKIFGENPPSASP